MQGRVGGKGERPMGRKVRKEGESTESLQADNVSWSKTPHELLS